EVTWRSRGDGTRHGRTVRCQVKEANKSLLSNKPCFETELLATDLFYPSPYRGITCQRILSIALGSSGSSTLNFSNYYTSLPETSLPVFALPSTTQNHHVLD